MDNRFAASIVLLTSLFFAGCSSAPVENTNMAAAAATPAIAAADFSDANAALAEGIKLLDIGDTDRGIEVLNRAVEINPDLADAYFQLGIAYALVETRDAAVIEEQVTPTPTPGEKKQRVAATNSEKAFEKAVVAYKKQIDANGKDDVAYFNLGRAYNKLNEDEDAAKALKEAVELKPDDTDYQTELGAILVKLAQYREAISPLRKAVELDPENSRAIDLLEDAEAGRKRIDFVTDKKDANKTAGNSNTNTSPNSATAPPSNTAKPADTKTPPPPPKPATANRPQKS